MSKSVQDILEDWFRTDCPWEWRRAIPPLGKSLRKQGYFENPDAFPEIVRMLYDVIYALCTLPHQAYDGIILDLQRIGVDIPRVENLAGRNELMSGFLSLAISGKEEGLKRVEELLDAGCDPDRKFPGSPLPLRKALVTRALKTVGLLLSRGADPDIRPSDTSWPILSVTLETYRPFEEELREVLSLLIFYGADVNKVYEYESQGSLLKESFVSQLNREVEERGHAARRLLNYLFRELKVPFQIFNGWKIVMRISGGDRE
jgi:hypothetical protein